MVSVEIQNRLYDYTDEERAADAINAFQAETGLDDIAIIALWNNQSDVRRPKLDRLIIEAIDANGSVKRAKDNTPCAIHLGVDNEFK